MVTKILASLFIVFFVVPFVLRTVLRFLFGSPAQTNNTSQQRKNTSSASSHTRQTEKGKVIPEDEGEYIDYEEIKD